jgi:hypothetical protein
VAAATRRYPALKIIHLVRDPRDAIASMMSRRRVTAHFSGLTDEENLRVTARQWAILNARALARRGDPNVMLVRYEELVTNPDRTLNILLQHVGSDPGAEWPEHARPIVEVPADAPTWLNSPQLPISIRSIGHHRAVLNRALLTQLREIEISVPELSVRCSMRALLDEFAWEW